MFANFAVIGCRRKKNPIRVTIKIKTTNFGTLKTQNCNQFREKLCEKELVNMNSKQLDTAFVAISEYPNGCK